MSYNRYNTYKMQYSIDSGATWIDVTPIEIIPSGDPISSYDSLIECEKPTYYTKYLTFIPSSRAQFVFVENYYNAKTANTIDYSIDSGATWHTLCCWQRSPIVESGHTIMWRGNCVVNASGIGVFASTAGADYTVEGNVNSLMYGDYFANYKDVQPFNFKSLFGSGVYGESLKTMNNDLAPGAKGFYYGRVINAENLILPAEILQGSCYASMFEGSFITTPPQLPSMFLADSCYRSMFMGCPQIAYSPELPATRLAPYCYAYMFSTSNLQEAPDLPSTRIANGCYQFMFNYCKLLTKAPSVLPATTLAPYCYYRMFYYCERLVIAPHLPAPTLVEGCYRELFGNCKTLQIISCLATSGMNNGINKYNNTTRWVESVGGGGRFLKSSEIGTSQYETYPEYWSEGWAGIPEGWRVSNYCGSPVQYRTLNTATTCVGYDKYVLEEYQYSYNCGNSWVTSGTSATTLIEENSEDCGYIQPENRKATITKVGNIVYKGCDETSAITRYDISNGSYYGGQDVIAVEIGECVTSIDTLAFFGCAFMTGITIPDNVTTIGNSAFRSCSELKSVEIGSGITSIGDAVFIYGLWSLNTITIHAVTPPTLAGALFAPEECNPIIYVPRASVEAYKAADGWSGYADRFYPIPNS